MKKPKILFFDIETKPVKAWVWRTGKQYINHPQIVDGEKFDIICIVYKLSTERKFNCLTWDKNQNSAAMIEKFAKVVEEADVIVGQNSDSFDIKQINTQRMLHRQPPIAWPTSEDTRKQILKHFYVTSSSLEYMSKLLTGSGKSRMEFRDWIDIVDRKSTKALRKMVAYCKRDVRKLEELWKRIRPYITPKVHIGVITHGDRKTCPNCGHKHSQSRGLKYLVSGVRQRRICTKCRASWTCAVSSK